MYQGVPGIAAVGPSNNVVAREGQKGERGEMGFTGLPGQEVRMKKLFRIT
jgi:hypothetical protein